MSKYNNIQSDEEMKPVIMVIDDDDRNTRLLESKLIPLGYQMLSAGDGEEALRIIPQNMPDLILLDIMMPKINGFEVCQRLKEQDETKIIPIVMVTALKDVDVRIKALECGADDFLSKPVNKWELMTRVKTMLKLRHLTDKLERTLAYMTEVEEEAQKTSPVGQ